MTPYTQLIQHAPSIGQWGDCYRTAIGCLLDYPPEAVPHFSDCADRITPSETEYLTNKWLGEMLSLRTVSLPFNGDHPPDEITKAFGTINPGAEYLFSGLTRIDTPHIVVCRDTEQIHDPSGGDWWIVAPHKEQKGEERRWYWVTVLAVDFNDHIKDGKYKREYLERKP